MKKALVPIISLLLVVALAGCGGSVPTADYDELKTSFDKQTEQLTSANAQIEAATKNLNELQTKYDTMQAEQKALVSEYDAYKTQTADWILLSDEQKATQIAQATAEKIVAEQEQEALEAAQKAAAEEEARIKEEALLAEQAQGYETGISYDDLARSPDDYKGKKVKFTGYVAQIMEGELYNNARISTSGKYDNIIYTTYDPSLLDVRLLEEDYVTIYGTYAGLYTYETVRGDSLTIPAINIDRIDLG